MRRALAAIALPLALASQAISWPLSFGNSSGNRVAAGQGTFPRWHAVTLATEAPLRWLVALPPRRLAAVDRNGTLWIFEVARTGLRVAGRYGDAASADGPPAAVKLDRDRTGVALVAPDGRLLIWSDGALGSHDVGASLSRLTCPTPVTFDAARSPDLLAVARDGSVVLITGLATGSPRVVARADVHALLDARIAVEALTGDGVLGAVVLSDPTDRNARGLLGDRLEAASVTVIGVRPQELEVRGRFALPERAVFDDLMPVVAPIGGSPRPALLLTRSVPGQGSAMLALGWADGALSVVAEGPSARRSYRWTHVIGALALTGNDTPQIFVVDTPHINGALAAYRRVGGSIVRVARAPGYSSHAIGSRNLDQALVADLDGNGLPEVVVPRQSRDVLSGLELQGERFFERWAVELKGPVQSNLVAADLDGDGLLDLAAADRHTLRVFLSVSK